MTTYKCGRVFLPSISTKSKSEMGPRLERLSLGETFLEILEAFLIVPHGPAFFEPIQFLAIFDHLNHSSSGLNLAWGYFLEHVLHGLETLQGNLEPVARRVCLQ